MIRRPGAGRGPEVSDITGYSRVSRDRHDDKMNWIRDHTEELMDRWNLARAGTEFGPIDEELNHDAFYR
jgi:hypothetical protein